MNDFNTNALPALSRAKLKLLGSLVYKKYRQRERKFVAEGVRLLEEALSTGVCIDWAVLEAGQRQPSDRELNLLDRLLREKVPVFRCEAKSLGKALDTVQPQTLAGVCSLGQEVRLGNVVVPEHCLLVLCDRLSEPGNLGAVIRAAASSGADLVLTTPGTADPWSPKCVRASAGALFRLPVVEAEQSAPLLEKFFQEHGFTVFEAAALGRDVFAIEGFPARTAVVLGSEAGGVGSSFARLAGSKISVPMARGVESLNVAVAAGIILYEIGRKRLKGGE